MVSALRAAGVTIHTLPELFDGEAGAMRAEDTDWIEVAGRNGWAALTKNKKIRYVTAEREAVAKYGVPLFALANGNLGLAEMAGALLLAMPEILRICEQWPGGSIWIVHRDGQVAPHWP